MSSWPRKTVYPQVRFSGLIELNQGVLLAVQLTFY
jgi:hypothetical protein